MSEHFLPCPHCGKTPTFYTKGDGTATGWFTDLMCECGACFVGHSMSKDGVNLTKQQLADGWNQRVDVFDDLLKDIDVLRDTVKRLNRRCQLAESAVSEKIKQSDGSFGRTLANAGYQILKKDLYEFMDAMDSAVSRTDFYEDGEVDACLNNLRRDVQDKIKELKKKYDH